MKKTAITFGAALVASTIAWGAAEAIPIGSGGPPVVKEANTNIETVGNRSNVRYWRHGRHNNKYAWRHNRHGYDGNDAWGYGGAFLGGVLLGSALDDDYDDYPHRRYREDDDYGDVDNHVAYCLSRYRSYHVTSDTFMGYDGKRHRCNSPY